MTQKELKKLAKELRELATTLCNDLREGYLQDALDTLSDIQGVACMVQEGVEERLAK